MAVTPVQVSFQGNLQGVTTEGALTPVQFNATLSAQDSAAQLGITVLPSDTDKLVDLSDDPGTSTKQVLFMMKSTQNVQFVLNGDPALTFAVNAGFPFFIPGQPEIRNIRFTSLAAVAAQIFITRVFGVSTLPTIGPGGGGALPVDAASLTYDEASVAGAGAVLDPSVLRVRIATDEEEPLVYLAALGAGSDGRRVSFQVVSGMLDAVLLPNSLSEGLDGPPGSTYTLSPLEPFVTFEADITRKTWWKVG